MEKQKDFLDQPFKTVTCNKCREKYQKMSIDHTDSVCPKCDNKWWTDVFEETKDD